MIKVRLQDRMEILLMLFLNDGQIQQFGFPLLILYTLVVVILVEIEYTNIIHLMILVD